MLLVGARVGRVSGGLGGGVRYLLLICGEGEVLLTDGPFADTKELIGGFGLVECADLDEALEVAAEHPAAGYGSIEIRPLLPP